MDRVLDGRTVAIVVADGVEESELSEPMKALEAAGARTRIVSPNKNQVRAWSAHEWSREYGVDLSVAEASVDDFDALLLPGGVMNPDTLRGSEAAIKFIREFVDSAKPIAAICHGPWTLIDADAVRGRRMTSYKTIRTDLINAGAQWLDQEVVVDNGLVTSRSPGDLPAFIEKMLEEFAEGVHQDSSRGRSKAAEQGLPGHSA